LDLVIWSARHACHLPAFHGTALAFIGTALAMFDVVLAALGATCFADVCANSANLLQKVRAAAHKPSRGEANLGAIPVHPNAICHFCDIRLVETGIGAMLALLSASQASVETHLVFFM
jgi:hypothetical protein